MVAQLIDWLDRVWDPHGHLERLLREIDVLGSSRVGVEMSLVTMAANSVCGEVSAPCTPMFRLIGRAFGAQLVDATSWPT